MGNCLKGNKILEQVETHEASRKAEEMERSRSLTPLKFSEAVKPMEGRKKKVVRFKLGDDDIVGKESDGCAKGGVVRFRVVVSHRELNQILNYSKDSKFSSVEHLLSAMQLRGRMISAVGTSDGDVAGSWTPALQSIPEDH